MARKSTGGVVVDERRKSAVFALRFRAYGTRRYVRLGTVDEGWTQERAEEALRHVLADVERGIWRPPEPAPEPPDLEVRQDPTFLEFASDWYRANEGTWQPSTRLDYSWQLTDHLLPYFARHRLSQITAAEVDRYRATKVRDGKLSATSINKTIARLAQILELAVEYELLDRNPAKGKRRRVKASRPAPVWLDRAEHIRALLDAARDLDRRAERGQQHVRREAMLATLVFAGLRLGELLQLRWRDVDLVADRITVRQSKTDAGVRRVDVLPALHVVLATVPRRGPDDLVFGTAARRTEKNPDRVAQRFSPSNIRRRVLAPAVERANEVLELAGEVPLPRGITPHKLRHTFASLLVALGEDPGSVMDQLGHTDAGFTLRVYRHGMRRDVASKEALQELVGRERVAVGSNVVRAEFAAGPSSRDQQKNPAVSGAFY
jgi:integrase